MGPDPNLLTPATDLFSRAHALRDATMGLREEEDQIEGVTNLSVNL